MEHGNDEKDISAQSWNKMTQYLLQEGYREGTSAGREESFQQGFNSGYHQGFQIGFKLGLHNGVLKLLNSDSNLVDSEVKKKISSIKPFENPSKGLCVLCNEESASGSVEAVSDGITSLEEVVNKQMQLFCEKGKNLLTTVIT